MAKHEKINIFCREKKTRIRKKIVKKKKPRIIKKFVKKKETRII